MPLRVCFGMEHVGLEKFRDPDALLVRDFSHGLIVSCLDCVIVIEVGAVFFFERSLAAAIRIIFLWIGTICF